MKNSAVTTVAGMISPNDSRKAGSDRSNSISAPRVTDMTETRDGRGRVVDPYARPAAIRRTSRSGRGRIAQLGAALLLAAALLAIVVSSASAAYVHTNVTGEYGKGAKAGEKFFGVI